MSTPQQLPPPPANYVAPVASKRRRWPWVAAFLLAAVLWSAATGDDDEAVEAAPVEAVTTTDTTEDNPRDTTTTTAPATTTTVFDIATADIDTRRSITRLTLDTDWGDTVEDRTLDDFGANLCASAVSFRSANDIPPAILAAYTDLPDADQRQLDNLETLGRTVGVVMGAYCPAHAERMQLLAD